LTPPPSVNLPGRDPTPVLAPAVPVASVARSPDAVRAERRAWLIIWLAFATFCLLVASAAKVALDYVATAEIDLMAGVEVPRGTIFVQSSGGPKYQLAASELGIGTVIEADRNSNPPASLRLRLFDGSHVSVQAGSRIELLRMDVGRFINRRSILLRQTAGPVRYEAVDEVQVQVPGGLVRMRDADVTVWVLDTGRTKILVYGGQARLEAGTTSATINQGERADLGLDHGLAVGPRAEQLLPNGDFAHQFEGWAAHDQQSGPPDVDGQRLLADGPEVDGVAMPALRVLRRSVRNAHGETGLVHKLNVPVQGYRHLWLDAWVRVDWNTLSGGGQLGSEYPMMLVLDYEGTQQGSAPNWYHGFYATNPDQLRVDQGQHVDAGEWVNYRIDLMTQEDARKPFRITGLKVMGQGYSYDARVADIRLIGD
jgi:hypothetical protein